MDKTVVISQKYMLKHFKKFNIIVYFNSKILLVNTLNTAVVELVEISCLFYIFYISVDSPLTGVAKS